MTLRWKYSKHFLTLLVAYFAVAPLLGFGFLKGPGIQQTFAVAFLWGALALTYDLLFGFTGLLSFGHALFFASGVYMTTIFVNRLEVNIIIAGFLAVLGTMLIAVIVGAFSLRTTGITFAMVTLAFGELGRVFIERNFWNLSQGDNGLPINAELLPQFLIGVLNTKFLYWLALLVLITVYISVWWLTETSAGRVFAALRDNELRVSVIGLKPSRFKLLSFTISAALASICGGAMAIVAGSASPRFATADVTIALLLMVILGGTVSRWGAVLGGMIYSIASTRLQDLNQAELVGKLPKIISGPLSEPTFILGLIFILIVMFAPGGLSGAYYRARFKYLNRNTK
jgi:branched-chain amino acid transport system permease protein